MQIKTPVICINGSANRTLIIRNNIFGMNKSWLIFKNSDARLYQFAIIGYIDHIHIPFIRNSRYNNSNIYPTLSGTDQIISHTLIKYKIWCRNVDIIPGFVDHSGVSTLCRIAWISVRSTGKWLYIAIFLYFYIRTIFVIFKDTFGICCFPHCHKNTGKAPHAFSIKSESCILPMSKTHNIIGVLICQINASCISDIAINYCNLLMVTIIKRQSCHIFMNWIKNTQLYSSALQIFTERMIIDNQCTKVIKQ